MEPGPVTAEEIIAPPHAMQSAGLGVHRGDASHLPGEDVEPPYLRLRTLVDESQAQDRGSHYTPELDLTEFATLAENTGVEIVRRDVPALPRTLIADVASFPHAMPTGIEPATEVVVSAKALSFSRTRLFGWGSAAFCAGLLASAAAHMLMAPAHLGPTANAATVSTKDNAAPQVASAATSSAAAPAPSPSASAPVALAAPAAPAAPAPAPAATELARADAPNLAAPAPPTSVRTRSGAAALARGQTRARGRMRSAARTSSTAAALDTPSDEPAAKPAPDSTDDAPAARHAAGWVDPFAQ